MVTFYFVLVQDVQPPFPSLTRRPSMKYQFVKVVSHASYVPKLFVKKKYRRLAHSPYYSNHVILQLRVPVKLHIAISFPDLRSLAGIHPLEGF
jgi:hypothetical protein